MDLTQLLTAQNGALGFVAVVLWKAIELYVLPRIFRPKTPDVPPEPAPGPSPLPPKPNPVPTPQPVPAPKPEPEPSDRPILNAAIQVLTALANRLLLLLPLVLDKLPEEERKKLQTPPEAK